jgi:dTMP kinase
LADAEESPLPRAGELSGFFFTFEGCEGSGKTTQVELLREHLAERGFEVLVSREPGGTGIGARIREILLDPEQVGLEPLAEALLFAADRAQQVAEVILPAMRKGWVVIGDRFVDSSFAYQGVARGLGLEEVTRLNEWVTGGLEPTLTFYLDMPVEEALARKSVEGQDRIESEPAEFHWTVREAYLMLAKLHSHRVVVIDARGSREEIHGRVKRELGRVL